MSKATALAPAEIIAERPIETVLSGPAASVIGAKFLSGRRDFIMADIGGTTTDVAILENGWPRLNRTGAVVGSRRTMVRAIDMHTFALGGDTEADIDAQGRVELGNRRIVPLALLGARYPGIIATMHDMLGDSSHVPYAGRFVLRPFGQAPHLPHSGSLGKREIELSGRIGDRPIAQNDIVFSPADQRALTKLVSLGLVHTAGFTPSDAAHILNAQNQWSREAAVLGGALLLRWRRTIHVAASDHAPVKALATDVMDAVVTNSGRVLLEVLAERPLDDARPLVDAVVSGRGRLANLRVALSPVFPIVAVGGPAPVYYPEVGRRLGCEVVLPPHGEVANAVGAGVGVVRARVMIEVTAPGPGFYRVHHADAPSHFAMAGDALDFATSLANRLAQEGAVRLGADTPIIDLHVDRVDIPGVPGDRGLIAATIIAESWGRPRVNPNDEAAGTRLNPVRR